VVIPIGYLLAAIAARFCAALGWRPMFWIGALPALSGAVYKNTSSGIEAWSNIGGF